MSDPKPEAGLELDARWDRLLDVSLRRLAYGLTVGGLTGLLIFRGSHARASSAAFGAGIGIGSAWQQVHKEFEDLIPSLLRQ